MKHTIQEKIIFSIQVIFSCLIIYGALRNYFFITGKGFSEVFPQVEIDKSVQIKSTIYAIIKGFIGIIGILFIYKNKRIGFVLSFIFWLINLFEILNFLIHENINFGFWLNLIFSIFIVIILYFLFISLKKNNKNI